MEKIVKFVECLVPVSICNLKCEYCYLIQQNRRNMENKKWKYSPKHVSLALSKTRLGGTAYISLCGEGETLICDDVIELTYFLLEEGHYVNITTNGTLTKKFELFKEFPNEFLNRLHFAFSFHYLELKKKNLIGVFFDNIRLIRGLGCSFVLQLNMYDGYVPYIDEIKKLSIDNVGALPQVALTRQERINNNKTEYKVFSNYDISVYSQYCREFNSPLFEFTLKNFNVKRHEFCYAGLWSFVLDLQDGSMRKCYSFKSKNIFDDIQKPIDFSAVGVSCPNKYCINSSHFLSLGVIPSVATPSYAELRNREEVNWYNNTMKEVLSYKLSNANDELSNDKKILVYINCIFIFVKRGFKRILPNKLKSFFYNLRSE